MKPARFRILIEQERVKYHLADASINVSGGDIFYFPSKQQPVGRSSAIPSGRTVDHISFHKDGRTHFRDTLACKHSAGNYLKIRDIGFRIIVQDKIGNIQELPIVSTCLLYTSPSPRD